MRMTKHNVFAISKAVAVGAINAVVYMKLHELKEEDPELYKIIINEGQTKKHVCGIVSEIIFFDIQNMNSRDIAKFDTEIFAKIAAEIFNSYFIITAIDN